MGGKVVATADNKQYIFPHFLHQLPYFFLFPENKSFSFFTYYDTHYSTEEKLFVRQKQVFAFFSDHNIFLRSSFLNFIIKVILVFVRNVVHIEISLACTVPVKCDHLIKSCFSWTLKSFFVLIILPPPPLDRCDSQKISTFETSQNVYIYVELPAEVW